VIDSTGISEPLPVAATFSLRNEDDACLVPTDAFTPEKWERLNDPFPAWDEAQTALEPAA
jgi:hypothetical protein